MNDLSVLVLDDEQGYRDGLEELLTLRGHKVMKAGLPSEAITIMQEDPADILLLDLRMPEMDGIDVLKIVKEHYPSTEVIIITGHGELQNAIEAMRYGATDFITKPFRSMEIEHAIERTRKFTELNNKLREVEKHYSLLSQELNAHIGTRLIGKSRAIREIVALMGRVAATNDTTVLISGESGTGKELVARGIHHLSRRRKQYFHSVNCAAVPETLFESEFFGHRKGAFTGAADTLPGWFEVSNNGTLFLDEISGLPLSMQSKFLRVLDQRTISKLGSHKEVLLNIRVIAATNQDLEGMIKEKTFREDLFHRLNSFQLRIPPLRERKEDIPLLIDYFVEMFGAMSGRQITDIDNKIYRDLENYPFPGNVRELKNMIERAVILSDGRALRRKDLFLNGKSNNARKNGRNENLHLDTLISETVMIAMDRARGNKSKAAHLLGISRQALDRKLEKLKTN